MKKLIIIVFLAVYTYLFFLLYKTEKIVMLSFRQYVMKQDKNEQDKNELPKLERLILPCKEKLNWITRENNTQNITYAPKTVITINKVINTENYKLNLLTFNK